MTKPQHPSAPVCAAQPFMADMRQTQSRHETFSASPRLLVNNALTGNAPMTRKLIQMSIASATGLVMTTGFAVVMLASGAFA